MHDNAIELRTRVVLENETEDQQQQLTDLKLNREHQRAAQIRQEDEREIKHTLAQLDQKNEQKLTAQKKEREQELQLIRQRHEIDKLQQQELLELRFAEWNKIHSSGADLTAVLVAQQNNPDKTIRLDHKGGAEVHLHEAV